VAVDQRGHGESERHPADLSRAAYIADVVAVADHLEMARPVLVGQSLGGHTAMLAAATHPDLVRALVMIEAGPGGPEPETPSKIGAWLDSWPTPFPTHEEAVEFFGGGALGRGWADGLEERDGRWWPRFERDVMLASLAENAERSYWPEWARIRCPTLLVLAQSSFISARDVERMLRQRPDTFATSIPGTGHDVHLQQPDALYAAIADFLTSVHETGCRS
jgi:pimeloyl-ACP methyl ester carboxylesterase